jgi:hypothetical protein
MKYLPTINLWDPAINQAVVTGRLVLQPGQWVSCGSSKPSRFVKVSKGRSIYAVHPQSDKVTNERFKVALSCW